MNDLNLNRLNALESGILGESRGSIGLETSMEHKAASLSLFDQARKTIDIMSNDLEPKIYNNREMYQRFRRFATLNSHSHIRILIHQARPIIQNGHMLVELIQKLTSSIEVKRLSDQDKNISQGFLIADSTGFLLRPEATRYEGKVDFNNRYIAKELGDIFDTAWQRAEPEAELRRLHL